MSGTGWGRQMSPEPSVHRTQGWRPGEVRGKSKEQGARIEVRDSQDLFLFLFNFFNF